MPSVDFVANLVMIEWFILWLICVVKIIQVSRYERRFKVYEVLSLRELFSISDRFRRIKHYRSVDPTYDRMRKSLHRWMIFTTCSGVLSFAGFLVVVFWAALRK